MIFLIPALCSNGVCLPVIFPRMHCSAPLVIGGLELVDYLWQCEMLRMHQGPRGLVTCDVLNANIPGMHQTLFARVTVRDSMSVRGNGT